MRKLESLSASDGVNALELIDSDPVSEASFSKAIAMLQANYGTEYSQEKVALFFDMIESEHWGEERFIRTLRWFLKNKPFPAWTMADWFSFSVKVYPYSWYLEQVDKNGRGINAQIQTFRLPGNVIVYRYRDGEELPFEEIK